MAKIFVSYARKDAGEIADELADQLRAKDHEVFLDVQSIRAGARWRSELSRRIKRSDLIVVLVTEGSNESDYVYQEIREAEQHGKMIVPVKIGDAPLPVHLRGTWQAITLEDDNLDAILLEIQSALLHSSGSRTISPMLGIMGFAIIVIIGILAFILLQGGDDNQNSQSSTETNVAIGITETEISEDTPIGTDTPKPPTETNTPEPPTATNIDVPIPTNTPTNTPEPPTATNTDIPTATNTPTVTPTRTPRPTSTPRPPTNTPTLSPTPTLVPIYFDNFDDTEFDGAFNPSLWEEGLTVQRMVIEQQSGILTFRTVDFPDAGGVSLNALQSDGSNMWNSDQILFETDLRLDSSTWQQGSFIHISAYTQLEDDREWWTECWLNNYPAGAFYDCNIHSGDRTDDGTPIFEFSTESFNIRPDTWYKVGFEMNPNTGEWQYYLNGVLVDEYVPQDAEALLNSEFYLSLGMWIDIDAEVLAAVDNVIIGR